MNWFEVKAYLIVSSIFIGFPILSAIFAYVFAAGADAFEPSLPIIKKKKGKKPK